MLHEVPLPCLADLLPTRRNSGSAVFTLPDRQFAFTGSGKGALALILKYLRHRNILTTKMDEILVPAWLGYWVYNQCTPYSFPVRQISPRTKAIIVYHQYGFPQDMGAIADFAGSAGLIMVEDCAHALCSFHKGHRLGTFADYSLFSFSKYVFCYALGGIAWKEPDFGQWLGGALAPRHGLAGAVKDFIKLCSENARRKGGSAFLDSYLLNPSYALYGKLTKASDRAVKLFQAKYEAEISIRTRRYELAKNILSGKGFLDHLEESAVCPYLIPALLPERYMETATRKIRGLGIMVSPLRFDIRRFLIEPKFVITLPLFCHSGISDELYLQQLDILAQL